MINIKNEEPKEFKTSEVNTIQLIARLLGPAVERGVLLEELGDFEEALETQAVLHKAKEMVMKRKDMSENDAYHAIRRRAIGDESSLREIAEAIIVSDVLV